LLNNKIFTLSPGFVEIYLKVTELCCFNQDILISQHLSIMQNWLKVNRFIAKDECPLSSPELNLFDYHVWIAVLEKYHKLQPKPKTTD